MYPIVLVFPLQFLGLFDRVFSLGSHVSSRASALGFADPSFSTKKKRVLPDSGSPASGR